MKYSDATAQTEPRYAGLNLRLIASTIDMLLLYLLTQPIIDYLGVHLFGEVDAPSPATLSLSEADSQAKLLQQLLSVANLPNFMENYIFSNVMQILFLGALSIGCWGKWGATPGMFLFRMRIVQEDTGEPVSYRAAAIRFLCYFVAAVPLGLGFLWIIWDKKRQGLHDKIARTVVTVGRRRKADAGLTSTPPPADR